VAGRMAWGSGPHAGRPIGKSASEKVFQRSAATLGGSHLADQLDGAFHVLAVFERDLLGVSRGKPIVALGLRDVDRGLGKGRLAHGVHNARHVVGMEMGQQDGIDLLRTGSQPP